MPDFYTRYKYQFLIPDTCLWYMLWISVFIPVLNFCYEFLSLISVTNTRISIRKKNSGRGKVGLREVKKTEKKRSEEEMEVGGGSTSGAPSSLLARKLLDVAPIVKLDTSNYQHNKNTHETCLSKWYNELSVSIHLNLGQRWTPRTRNIMWIISHSFA